MKRLISLTLTLACLVSLLSVNAASESSKSVTVIRLAQLATKRAMQIGCKEIDTSVESIEFDENGKPYANINGWIVYYDLDTLIVTRATFDYIVFEDDIAKTGRNIIPLIPGLSVFEYPEDNDIGATKEEDFNVKKTSIRLVEEMNNLESNAPVCFDEETLLYETDAYCVTMKWFYDEQNNNMVRISAHLIEDFGYMDEPVPVIADNIGPKVIDAMEKNRVFIVSKEAEIETKSRDDGKVLTIHSYAPTSGINFTVIYEEKSWKKASITIDASSEYAIDRSPEIIFSFLTELVGIGSSETADLFSYLTKTKNANGESKVEKNGVLIHFVNLGTGLLYLGVQPLSADE